MKISESVTSVLITLLGVFPFIWFTYMGRKTSVKSKKAIKDLLKGENWNFNQKEFWNHNFIGIDDSNNRLLFIKLETPENHKVEIDLNEIKTCQINKITRDFKRDKKMEFELQTLNLELTFASNKPKTILNFHEIKDNLSEDFEMKRAEKWQQIILQNIMKNKANNIAA